MGNFEVTQRTKDGMFNATSLLKQWNDQSGQRKGVDEFIRKKSTKEFVDSISINENLDTRNVVSVSKGGKVQGTWMHPYLFIDFAMWLNPSFKVKVIKFVYDELIKNRHDAGDNYRLLSESGTRLKGYNFPEVATALNWIVFNRKGKNLRQTATPEELKELALIEEKLSFSIDMGYIQSYTDLTDSLRKIYSDKYYKNPIKA